MRLFFVLITLLGFADIQAQIKIEAKVSAPLKVDLNNLFNITFTLENAHADSLKLPKMKHIKLVSGPVRKQSTNTYLFQGRLVQTNTTYLTYIAKADKKGKQELASASIWNKGKVYKTEVKQIEVEDPEERLAKERKSYKEKLEKIPFATFDELEPEDLFVKLEWENKDVVLDKSNTLLLRLFYKVNVIGCDEIEQPKIYGAQCETKEKTTEPKYSQAVVNGETYYTAVIKKYDVTPKELGECSIHSSEIMAYVQLLNKKAYLGGTKQVKRRLVVPGITFDVISEAEAKSNVINKKEKKQKQLTL